MLSYLSPALMLPADNYISRQSVTKWVHQKFPFRQKLRTSHGGRNVGTTSPTLKWSDIPMLPFIHLTLTTLEPWCGRSPHSLSCVRIVCVCLSIHTCVYACLVRATKRIKFAIKFFRTPCRPHLYFTIFFTALPTQAEAHRLFLMRAAMKTCPFLVGAPNHSITGHAHVFVHFCMFLPQTTLFFSNTICILLSVTLHPSLEFQPIPCGQNVRP